MNKISKNPDGTITLHPLKWNPNLKGNSASTDSIGVAVSLKTTGLNFDVDEIIELSYIKFRCSDQGELVQILEEKDFLQEPTNSLSEQNKEITFLTDEMLSGNKIPWTDVDADLSDVDFILSFNAQFERPFLEKKIKHKSKKWACVFTQIPWAKYGYPRKNLDMLCIYHNFYFEDAPGIEKNKAVLTLLEKKSPEENKVYLKVLLDSLSSKNFLVIALKSSYEDRAFFNENKFSFNKPLNMWFKYYDLTQKTDAESILEEMKFTIYEGIPFNGCLIEIDASKKFKPLTEFATLPGNEKIFTKEPPGKYTKPFMLIAKNLDISHRSVLNSRLYSWVATGSKHEWVIYVTEEEANNEKQWLKENLYHSHFKGTLIANKSYEPEP